MQITEVCANIRNYFLRNRSDDIHSGTFTISGGTISPLDFIVPGQFFRITGSALNEGVWQYTGEDMEQLQDETFEGAIWAMSVPRDFVSLCGEIAEWRAKNEAADSINMSPFMSESFGGYSYTKGAASTTAGSTVSWQTQFASRLNTYRRINVL